MTCGGWSGRITFARAMDVWSLVGTNPMRPRHGCTHVRMVCMDAMDEMKKHTIITSNIHVTLLVFMVHCNK